MTMISFDKKIEKILFSKKYSTKSICDYTGIPEGPISRLRTKKRNYLNVGYKTYHKIVEYYNYVNDLPNDDNYINIIKEIIFNRDYKIADMIHLVGLNKSTMSFYRNKKRDYNNISLANSIKCVRLYALINNESLVNSQ